MIEGPFDTPPPDPASKKIKVTEQGSKNELTFIYPTSKGALIPSSRDDGSGKPTSVRQEGRLTDPIPGFSAGGQHTFLLDYKYGAKVVTDYIQQTGDPAVLQATAFEGGFMVDSLFDWLDAMGYRNEHAIDQPDFFLVGGGDVYFAVDLAALGDAGNLFVSTHAFGSVFAINAGGGLDAMPFYQFSSTPFDYTPGTGWTGGTRLPTGTLLSFDAFHATSVPSRRRGHCSWSRRRFG